MKRGYKEEVKIEAITKRLMNLTWKEIQDSITQKFEVKPSIRQMQIWFGDYQHGSTDPTGVKHIARTMEDMIGQARMLAEAASGPTGPTGPQGVEFPSWVASQDDSENKLDVKTAIVASLRILESQVGKENLFNAVKYYVQNREAMEKYNNWFYGSTGPSGPPVEYGISEADGPIGSHRPFEPGGPTGSAGSLDAD